MLIAVPTETLEGERRVSLTPDVVKRLVADGHVVRVQRGAGRAAGHADESYADAGAELAGDAAATTGGAELVVKVNRPVDDAEVARVDEGAALVALLSPLSDLDGVQRLAARRVEAYAMELIPRISRAQSMDALSSMSTVAGYKAVIMAAERLGKLFPLLMTAAGTVPPARVLVLGAGVAGLQAIATARRLGAVVSAFDTRPVVKEQVQSLGATFLELELEGGGESSGGYARELTAEEQQLQRELVADHIAKSDVVITTALVPGRPAPKLIDVATVERMQPGSVIMDLASEAGGNCEVTRHGETVEHAGVHVVGPRNLPSTAAVHASQLYAKNVHNLLGLLVRDGAWSPDRDDEIVNGTCVTRGGEVVHPMVRERLGLPALATTAGGAG